MGGSSSWDFLVRFSSMARYAQGDLSGSVDVEGFLNVPYVSDFGDFVRYELDLQDDYVKSAPEPYSGRMEFPSEFSDDVRTVMIKHIPCRCTRNEVLAAIETLGFAGTYDFFHLPTRRGHNNFGYAFISFSKAATAIAFRSAMTGFIFQTRKSSKAVSVVPARIQGFAGTISQHVHRAKYNEQLQKQLADFTTMDLFLDTLHATWY